MLAFEELPDDDVLRVLKWFDGFVLPHSGTRSASVTVLFQRLKFKNVSTIDRLDEAEIRKIVGRTDNATGQDHYSNQHYHLLAGYIPHLRIGDVFKGRVRVGQLPASRRHVDLPDEALLTEAAIGDKLDPPTGWNDLPYRLMAARQFALPFQLFKQSRCLYFLDTSSATEYVIPRPVIFQTFYASHTLLANAFTSGAWASTARSLISESDFQSGLKTQVDPETGSWDLVLTPHVPAEDLAYILALFWFEPHARECAENVYAAMLKDAGRNGGHGWYASAKVPLRSNGSPLPLNVRGFSLTPRMPYGRSGSAVPRHTFMVTSITAFPWPAWAPAVRWEKTNSGAKGETQTGQSGTRPYGNPRWSHPTSGINATSAVDGSARIPGLEAVEDKISIIGAPPLEKIAKQRSIHYQGTRSTPPDDEDPSKVSSGNPSYRGDAQQPIRHRAVVRNSIASFAGLLDTMGALAKEHDTPLAGYFAIQPEDPSQLARTSGESCWNFLSFEQRQSGEWPRTGWRMVGGRGRRVPRTALILRITLRDTEGYWIEIEPRTPSEAMCSPLLLGLGGDVQKALRNVLEKIVEKSGHHLQKPLEEAITANGGRGVRCFRHRYATVNDEVRWSVDALRAFLSSVSTTVE